MMVEQKSPTISSRQDEVVYRHTDCDGQKSTLHVIPVENGCVKIVEIAHMEVEENTFVEDQLKKVTAMVIAWILTVCP